MFDVSLTPIDSAAFRFVSQTVLMGASLLLMLATGGEYRRSGLPSLHFINLSFTLLFAKTLLTLVPFALGGQDPTGQTDSILPMVDHLCKLGVIVLLAYGFIVSIPGWGIFRQFFLLVNLSVLVLFTAIVWLFWLQYLDTASPGQGKFSLFWGDVVYEVWILAVLCSCMVFIRHATLPRKGMFLAACIMLFAREMLHIADIVVSENKLAGYVAGEWLLLLMYHCLMAGAVMSWQRLGRSQVPDRREADREKIGNGVMTGRE